MLHLIPLAALLLLAFAAPAAAQSSPPPEDSVTVTAGSRYGAGRLKNWLLGRDYRELWLEPVRLPLLDLARYAGGLEPVRVGGGNQTLSLRLRGANGREYVFRSVDKRPEMAAHADFEGTLLGGLIQDQTSSMHPGAVLVSAGVLEALSVPHPDPRLVVMPDDPRLGEFRARFAGTVGALEERPDEREGDLPGFGGYSKIVGTDELFERLDRSPAHRVDARAYLKVRLVDLFLGDWDRHEDQWRWGRRAEAADTMWEPIPRDRDFALANYDGLALGLVRRVLSKAVTLGPAYTNLPALTLNAQNLDRRILAELPGQVWDSAAVVIGYELTDSVLEAAVGRLPAEYQQRDAGRLLDLLARRRDGLPEAAAAFYQSTAAAVDVFATDQPDLAELDRLPGGALRVRLYARADDGEPAGEPYFDRVLLPAETQEARLYLGGGDDRTVLRGGVTGIKARLVGGGGNDAFINASWVRGPGAGVSIHDDEGENRFFGFTGVNVDEESYSRPSGRGAFGRVEVRDQGSVYSMFAPFAAWEADLGFVVGGGPVYTRYGFRSHPYQYRVQSRAMYAIGVNAFAGEIMVDGRPTNSPVSFTGHARASQYDHTRFYGWGNDTERLEGDLFKVDQTRLLLSGGIERPVGNHARISAGPVFQYAWSSPDSVSALAQTAPTGAESLGDGGLRGLLVYDRGDHTLLPRLALHGEAETTVYSGLGQADGPFGRFGTTLTGYLPLPGPLEPTLSVRTGGAWAWGDFPYWEAAYLGGEGTLRGYPRQRFAGDASVFGAAELRTFLARRKLLVVRSDIGGILLADAGRVFHGGESAGGWNTSLGGGFWFGFLDRSVLVRATYVYGEEGKFYFTLGRGW